MPMNLETYDARNGMRAQLLLDEVELGARVAESFARGSTA
jgi:hypothetical protein